MGILLTAHATMDCDNQNAIRIATNQVFPKKIKHSKIECYLIHHHYLVWTILSLYTLLAYNILNKVSSIHPTSQTLDV